jgi:hypothetical protein
MESQQTQSFPPTVPNARQARALYTLAALLGLAVAVLFGVWLIGRGGGSSSSHALPKVGAGPAAVSTAQLETLAKQTGHPVYWAGSRDGTYELTRTTGGRIYIRYLPSAADVGDAAADYLTVGTYPQKNAFRSIQRAAKRPGAVSLKLPKGGLLVFNQQTPKSVYFGYPGAAYQVEVYDPSPTHARTLVLAGTIAPVR